MRVLVCGSRTWGKPVWNARLRARVYTDKPAVEILQSLVWGAFAADLNTESDDVLIHGAAPGADELASWFADDSPVIEPLPFPADWDRYGKSAGYIRNQQMLDEGKPDLVIAFVDKPLAESRGTKNMVHLAKVAGVKTVVVECSK